MKSSETKPVLIAAASGRALAAAARRSHYRPLVVDFFDDADTRALAARNLRIADPNGGFVVGELLEKLYELAAGEASSPGLVCGSGFEDRPDILDILAQHFSLFANGADIVARAKNPRELAALCVALEIPHPEICFDPLSDPENWLVKRRGGGGGIHIRHADREEISPEEYYQRRVPGAPVSVLLLADGANVQSLGTSSQWTVSDPAWPFRFGGAVRPVLGDVAQIEAIGIAAEEIAVALGLRGLNSVDFLADTEGFHLLEINPRPGATLDIFADDTGRLFAAHLDACRGLLPQRPLIFTKAVATAIAYAPCELPSMPALAWPDWCRDRQRPETFLHAGDPVCTILAEAETAFAARALLDERRALFDDHLLHEAQKECAA